MAAPVTRAGIHLVVFVIGIRSINMRDSSLAAGQEADCCRD